MEREYLQLEIRREVLAKLINSGSLIVEDVRPVNGVTQQNVRAMLLESLKFK